MGHPTLTRGFWDGGTPPPPQDPWVRWVPPSPTPGSWGVGAGGDFAKKDALENGLVAVLEKRAHFLLSNAAPNSKLDESSQISLFIFIIIRKNNCKF